MATGKSINLRVRPINSVDLAFPVDGVISKQSETLLGSRVEGIDVEVLYAMLSQTAEGQSSKLEWDSKRIFEYLFNVADQAATGPGITLISRLRNAAEAADLDRALMMRQNAYLTSYSPEILSEVRRVYYDDQRDQSAVRHKLLKAVESDAGRIHSGLEQVYKKHGWYNKIITHAFSTNDNKATQYSGSGHIQFEGFTDNRSWGYEFRYPSAENDLRYHQTRAAVRQEFLNAWRMSEMCRHGETTFANELGAIDRSIRKLQAAYIDTFLFAPFSGTVTGVFKGPGDYVRAGEPVLRVEGPEFVYLVGTVKYRGMLRIGTKLEVSTTLFEVAGAAPVTVAGEVVAVRGHDSVSEQWDLLIFCQNFVDDLHPEQLILPLNYNFDFESTTVTVIAV
jgi:hypothetical protein